MKPAGLIAHKKREDKNSKIYSFEQKIIQFDLQYEKIFKKNKKSLENFQLQPLYYRRTVIHWVTSAKQEKTRLKRLIG